MEAVNLFHSPYFANWRVKLKTSPTPLKPPGWIGINLKNNLWQKRGEDVHPSGPPRGDALVYMDV